MSRERVPNWVWLVLVAAHVLALGWALRTQAWRFPDSDRYQQAAENLRMYGELYARPWPARAPRGQAVQEFTIRPPGYPLVVLALAGWGPRPLGLLLLQDVLSLLNLAAVLGWWGRRARPTPRQWAGALALLLTFPGQLIYANALMSELLLQTAVLALVGAGLRFIQTGHTRWFGLSGVAVTAALLLKPVFYPLVFVTLAVGGLAAWRMRRPWLGALAAAPALVAALYMGWNWERTGYFHFSSIAEINLLHYNAAGVVRQAQGAPAEAQWVAAVLRQADAQPTFAARQQLIRTKATAVLRAHPGRYAGQHTAGMVTFFLDPGRFDIGQFLHVAPPSGGGLLAQSRAGGLARALGQLPGWLLALLALVGLANAVRLGLAVRGFGRLKRGGASLRYGRWLAAGLIGYVALLTGPLGAARFLVPVWPLLLALALEGWVPGQPPEASGADDAPPVGENQR